jgi:hypothetical protein
MYCSVLYCVVKYIFLGQARLWERQTSAAIFCLPGSVWWRSQWMSHYTGTCLTLTTLTLSDSYWHILRAGIILKIISSDYLSLKSATYSPPTQLWFMVLYRTLRANKEVESLKNYKRVGCLLYCNFNLENTWSLYCSHNWINYALNFYAFLISSTKSHTCSWLDSLVQCWEMRGVCLFCSDFNLYTTAQFPQSIQ